FEEKAGFAVPPNYYALDGAPAAANSVVPAASVVDLTSIMKPDGSLVWTPPGSGHWVIVRLGYSLTGHTNGPAPAERVGLEVDKLDKTHVAEYMQAYLKTYREALGPQAFGQHGVAGFLTDSFEAGTQNWTEQLIGEFRRRRGYDPRAFLLTL